jgi:hypothetical protein
MAWARDEKLLEPSIRQIAAAKTGFIGALHADSTPHARKGSSFARDMRFANPPCASRLTKGERKARNRFRCRANAADDAVLQERARGRTNREATNRHLNVWQVHGLFRQSMLEALTESR